MQRRNTLSRWKVVPFLIRCALVVFGRDDAVFIYTHTYIIHNVQSMRTAFRVRLLSQEPVDQSICESFDYMLCPQSRIRYKLSIIYLLVSIVDPDGCMCVRTPHKENPCCVVFVCVVSIPNNKSEAI